MKFIAISTISFVILSIILGMRKDGEKYIFALFLLQQVVSLIKYGFTGSFVVMLVFNILVLVCVISGIVKAKGELYLSDKYDEKK